MPAQRTIEPAIGKVGITPTGFHCGSSRVEHYSSETTGIDRAVYQPPVVGAYIAAERKTTIVYFQPFKNIRGIDRLNAACSVEYYSAGAIAVGCGTVIGPV